MVETVTGAETGDELIAVAVVVADDETTALDAAATLIADVLRVVLDG